MHGIEQVRDRIKVKEIVDKIQIEKFKPKTGVKIKENEDEDDSNEIGDEDENLIEELTKLFEQNYQELIKNVDLNPIDFEKDDDSNLHMDFITSCSNLRAQNYDISPTDKHNVSFCILVFYFRINIYGSFKNFRFRHRPGQTRTKRIK